MTDWNLVRFGARLRSIRQSRGISQEEMSAQLNIDRSYYGGIERGQRNPSMKLFFALAAALHLSPSEVLDE